MAHNMKTCDIDALNKLLRGELSAVETYNQAIQKFQGKPEAGNLTSIRDEHAHAADLIRHSVHQFGGKPSTDSGAWGTFANAVTGTAAAMGPETVLATLKKGEEHGISEYEEALENDEINPECKDMFRRELLPQCRDHVARLDALAASIS